MHAEAVVDLSACVVSCRSTVFWSVNSSVLAGRDQRWTVGIIKLDGSPCERRLAARVRYCHSGSFQVFHSGQEGIWWQQRSRARVWALHRPPRGSGILRGTGSQHRALERITGFCLGTEDIMVAQTFKIMIDEGLLAMGGLCAARRCDLVDPFCCSVRDTHYHASGRGAVRS